MYKELSLIKRATVIFLLLTIILPASLVAQEKFSIRNKVITSADINVGAQRTDIYYPLLKGKNVAVVANQTSMVGNKHLVDALLEAGIKVKKIFCPEHGFRGEAEAGDHLDNNIDTKTNLPVVSLYGKDFKPKSADLKDIDVVLFDIQDVGARFYTYISTMHYVMEACAENNIKFIVLDRPNPNGYYIDGPIREEKFKSFIGMHPVPVVHGMTIAEYACMVNGEGWLKNGIKCDLKYVTVDNYNHTYYYQLPIKPSPNLPNMNSVYLYPSLCLFEGTVISVGRGTDLPFQIIGHPELDGTYSFTPKSIPGVATNPPHEGVKCMGYNLSNFAEVYVRNLSQLYIFWLMGTYDKAPDKTKFFSSSFDKLAGTSKLREQIIAGVKEEDIRKSWQADIVKFKKIRKKYLLYPDFD